MTVEHRHSTNGHRQLDAPSAEAHTRAPARSQLRVRPARLLVPVLLALGVVMILRRFEQDAAG